MKRYIEGLTTAQKVLAALVALWGVSVGFYTWVESRAVERQSEEIADKVVERLRDEVVDPVLEVYVRDRKAEKEERERLEDLAVEYMTRIDSLAFEVSLLTGAVESVGVKVGRLESLTTKDTSTVESRQLMKIWRILEERNYRDSLDLRRLEISRAMRKESRKAVTGDRVE